MEKKTITQNNLPSFWDRVTSYINDRLPKGALAAKDTAPIEMGGTDATNAKDARVNLGITYGTEVPTETPETGSGAIYFFEDEYTPVSVVEGGTGANTAEGALENLGLTVVDITSQAQATKSSGNSNLTVENVIRYGNIITITMTAKVISSSISSGTDMWVGNISGIPLPASTGVTGASYNGGTIQAAVLRNTGDLIIRQTGGSISNSTSFSLTYIAAKI